MDAAAVEVIPEQHDVVDLVGRCELAHHRAVRRLLLVDPAAGDAVLRGSEGDRREITSA